MSENQKAQLMATCGRVFSPSAPVDRISFFAGRLPQIRLITQAIGSRGRHAIVYGDRGVGKTSLANILKDLFSAEAGMRLVRVNCTEADTFRSVWLRVLAEITVVTEAQVEKGSPPQQVEHTLDNYVHEVEQLGPGEIRRLLQRWSQHDFEMVLVFDEFDRLPEDERAQFADTIKDLSDHAVCTTLVLVGVADDVSHLFSEHASVERCLAQIAIPLMSDSELTGILNNAMSALKMNVELAAARLIISLSQGFPHYTHLLGQESVYAAVDAGEWDIKVDHVNAGIRAALEKTQQTIRNVYLRAAQGQRKGALFPHVMLACALAEVDEMGSFSSADVREPLCRITQKTYDIPNYAQHLDKFATDDSRGPILDKSGTSRRFRFKFRNPLLRPFIIMKGLTEGTITGDLIDQLRGDRAGIAEAGDRRFEDRRV